MPNNAVSKLSSSRRFAEWLSLRRQATASCFAALILVLLMPAALAQSEKAPNIVGVWEGEYPVAFARSNSQYADKKATMEMQLEVYRQEDHLFWAHNRWRPVGAAEWHSEEATGTFRLDDPTAFFIAENAPIPTDWATSGFFTGRIVDLDGAMMLTYVGISKGTTFSVALKRQ